MGNKYDGRPFLVLADGQMYNLQVCFFGTLCPFLYDSNLRIYIERNRITPTLTNQLTFEQQTSMGIRELMSAVWMITETFNVG